MPVKNAIAKNWASWIRGADGILRSDDPWGAYGTMTPVLPQADVDTTYSLPTGNTWTATNTADNNAAGTGTGNRTGCGLQYAVNNCARGDIIETTGSATYTIQLLLKYKATGSGWIYIRPSTHASLPAAGTRAVAADASNMAKLTGAAANTATIITENNTSFYRLIGLEITTSSSTASPLESGVCVIGNNNVSNTTVCDSIIFDRCYVHGSADGAHSGRRGFYVGATNFAIIDSSVTGFYDDGSDSQGIEIYQGSGPYLIENNYITAASENINFGGIDPQISGSVPTDVTVRRNHFFKPLAWIGAGHNVKNLFETKNTRRLLVEGNVFENCWRDGQSGMPLLLTPRNQDGTAPWCGVFDTTIRLNKFINCAGGINILGIDRKDLNPPPVDALPSQRVDRVLIENNLMDIDDPGASAGDRRFFQAIQGPERITIKNNTGLTAEIDGSFLYLVNGSDIGIGEVVSPKIVNLIFQDNILSNGTNGIIGYLTNTTAGTLPQNCDASTFTKNAIIGAVSGNVNGSPATGNFVPANNAAVGFTDISGSFAANDYTLTVGSAYHNAGTDGTDIGCDIAALNALISGVQ